MRLLFGRITLCVWEKIVIFADSKIIKTKTKKWDFILRE